MYRSWYIMGEVLQMGRLCVCLEATLESDVHSYW